MKVNLGCGTVIRNSEGEYLLVEEDKAGVRGEWNIPSGGYKGREKESLRQSAVRETREETGLEVELEGFIGFYTRAPEVNQGENALMVFEASMKSDQLDGKREGEISDAKFFSKQEIKGLNLRYDILQIIQDFEENSTDKINITDLKS
jgi:8-oxo-dGTP diphosphatase